MTIKSEAIKFAHKTDGNEEFLFAQTDAVVTFMKNKTRAYSLFLTMCEMHGTGGNLPKVYQPWPAAMPVPGSEKGTNPDKFTELLSGKEVDGTFWNVYADATEFATKVNPDQINAGFIAVLNAVNADQEPYASMSDPDKAEQKKMATQRRDANRKAINTAARIHFKRDEVVAFGGGVVEVAFKSIKDKDGDTVYDEDTTTPIVVHATGEGSDPSEYVRLSVGEFLALDLAKAKVALDAGGVSKFMAVRKSGGKGTKKKGANAAAKPGEANIKTMAQAENAFSGLAHWMGDADEGKDTGYDKIMSHLASLKPGDDRKAFVYTVGRVAHAIDAVYTEISSEYLSIVQEMVRAKKAA